jgi:hypothetical protein
MVTAGFLVLVMSASHLEDAGDEQPTLTHRGAVSAQVEVGVLVSEFADRREHPSELGPCTGSAAGAGFVGIECAVHRLDCTQRRQPLALVEDGLGMCSTVDMAAPFCRSASLLRGPAWFPSASGFMRLQPRRDRLPRHRSQRPFRRCDSRNEHLPASGKSGSNQARRAAKLGQGRGVGSCVLTAAAQTLAWCVIVFASTGRKGRLLNRQRDLPG